MRLNLACGHNVIVGYVNIDLHPINDQVQQGNFKDLNDLGISDDSVEEIRTVYGLNFVNLSEINQVLTGWLSKLQPGGDFYIEFVDYEIVANMINHDQLDINQVNDMLSHRQGLYTLRYLKSIMENLGYKILGTGINEIFSYIRATK